MPGAFDGKDEVVPQETDPYREILDDVGQARVLEGIRKGLEDMRAGRTLTLEEFKEHVRIRHGIEDMRAGRTQPLDEAFADIRRELGLPQTP